MPATEKSTDVLNGLIGANNDRAAGFEKALADMGDENTDLKQLFQEYAAQSRRFSLELTRLVAIAGSESETRISAGGSLHRAWIDIKPLFSKCTRESILSEVERGESAIKMAYRNVLSESGLSAGALSLLIAQVQDIDVAHDRISALRDASKNSF